MLQHCPNVLRFCKSQFHQINRQIEGPFSHVSPCSTGDCTEGALTVNHGTCMDFYNMAPRTSHEEEGN